MRLNILSVVGCAVLVSAWPAVPAAQQPQQPQEPLHRHLELTARQYDGPPLSLETALAEAEQHPSLQALRAEAAGMRFRPAQARALEPPRLDTQAWQWPVNTLNPASTNMFMFTITQTLASRDKRAARAEVAGKDLAIAESDVDLQRQQIAAEVKQTYAALALARRAIDVHIESAELLRQIADVSQARYESGHGSQQDVLGPVVEISRLHADVIEMEVDANLAAARLNGLMGRPTDAPIGPLSAPPDSVALPALADLQRLATERRPELRRIRTEVEKAEAQRESARRDTKPDLMIQGGYMLAPHMTDAWTASVGITWPKAPWSRRGPEARIAEAGTAVDAAKARVASTEIEIQVAVQQAYIRVRAEQERLGLLRSTLIPQARQALEVSRAAYQADRGEFASLLTGERTLLEAQLDAIRATAALSQAVAALEQAVGGSVSAADEGRVAR